MNPPPSHAMPVADEAPLAAERSAPPADGCSRPMRADARRNRERILAAALQEFAERGVEAQMDDVARRADLGVGTIYRHFPTKEALVAELVREKFRRMVENAREAVGREGDPFELLTGVMRRNAESCARDATMQQALSGLGDQIWTYAESEIAELYELTAVLVERAHRAGALRADITVNDIPMLMCGVASSMGRSNGRFDWHRHLELVLDMLRPGGGQGPASQASAPRAS